MDQFTKLAELVGAIAAPIGDGLPRTRADALALGVKRYFTGAPCPQGHVAARVVADCKCTECRRQYSTSPEVTERRRRWRATPEGAERKRLLVLKKTGDEILFAINQAENYARQGRASANIVTQCPEPQRSRLQALVDRIKADPQAGKAVVGLLRTMRELRKAELAEMRAES